MRRLLPLIMLFCILGAGACRQNAAETGGRGNASAPQPPAFVPVYSGNTPEDMVKNLVLRYNQLLAFGYENLNMNYLQEVATEQQATKAYYHMAAIGEGGVRMRSKLKKIEWMRIETRKQDAIRVKTRETWDFAYHDIKTDQKTEAHNDVVYFMTYTLIPDKSARWLISDIQAASDEAPKSASRQRRAPKSGAVPAGSSR